MTVEALCNTADLEDAREKLIHSFGGLQDDLLDEPSVVGHWSIRQTLAHFIGWDRWAEETLAALERGETVPGPSEDETNSAAVESLARATETMRQELRGARLRLIGRFAAMTDAERADKRYAIAHQQLSADEFIDRLIEHDLEHASEIRAWRKAKGV